MFQCAKDAGLGPRDLSKLLPVTRQTASNWLNGHTTPNKFLHEKVVKLLACVRAAVAAGDLPIPHETPWDERRRKIAKALSKHGWQTS